MMSTTPHIQASDPRVKGEIALLSSEGGIELFRLTLTLPEAAVTTPVTVLWEEEFLNTLYTWYPTCRRDLSVSQWFGPRENNSGFNFGAPILSSIGSGGRNTATISVSDPHVPITILSGIRNAKRGENIAEYRIRFFDRPCTVPLRYTADIRIDRRPIPFHEAVMSVYPWWTEYGHIIPPCPKAAEEPLYSTWYSCYQNPIGKDILEDLKLAAEAGFKTVILDDGWQFEGDEGKGYSKCGDWIPAKDKFPDFKAFTDAVHGLGMKLMVWFGVPFAGYSTEMYEKFKDKVLSNENSMGCAILDPRFPEVRRHTVETYRRFLREYNIDGFKLDFVGSIQPEGETLPYDSGVMDAANVEDGAELLLREITTELAKEKADLLYEFRQGYIGPSISRYGSMLRVGDCAYDGIANRIGTVNLRLMNYPIAVHSDMMCWSAVEDAKVAAKQLLDVLFAVPQISVFLGDITEDQRRLIKHYLTYHTANRDILLHGKFRALYPEYNYTVISAEGEEKIITVLYGDTAYTYEGKPCDVHLNGNRDGLIFENPTDRELHGEIYNCFGELLEAVHISGGSTVRLAVPETGMLSIH